MATKRHTKHKERIDPVLDCSCTTIHKNFHNLRKFSLEAHSARSADFQSISICPRSEEHTSELQSPYDLVCRLLLEKKNLASHFFDLVIGKILTSRLSLSKHLAHNLGNLLLLGKIRVFHNRRNASSRLLLLISKHLILCIYLFFRIFL